MLPVPVHWLLLAPGWVRRLALLAGSLVLSGTVATAVVMFN